MAWFGGKGKHEGHLQDQIDGVGAYLRSKKENISARKLRSLAKELQGYASRIDGEETEE